MYGPYFPQFLRIRFYEDRGQDLNDPDRAIASSNLTSWLLTGQRITTRATSMFHTFTTSTAPFTIGRPPRSHELYRLGLILPLLTGTRPHLAHIPLRLPSQEPNALNNSFVHTQEMETLLRQLQHITPGPHELTPLLIFDGNHIVENRFFESDDETVVLQILPRDSLLRPRPLPIVTQQLPLPPATSLMDPLQLYYWYW